MNALAAPVSYDDAPLKAFHLKIGVASVGGAFADGFGLGIIGISLSLAAPRLGLTPLWLGLLGGASLAGLFAGALLTGPLADRWGRRWIFATNMVLAAVVSAMQYFAATGLELLVLRVAIGFLLGTDYVVSKSLLSEFVPRRYRGRILSLLSIAWAGGYACAYGTGFLLSAHGAEPWRWMLLASALPCLLIAPLRVTLPESPLWLASHNQAARAARIVQEKFGAGVRPPPATPIGPTKRGRWAQLLSKRWRLRTLVACLFFTCQVIPYFAVGTFVAQVMTALRLEGGLASGLIYNLALIAGAISGVLVVERLSRRRFLIGSFTIAAITMLPVAAGFRLATPAIIALFAVFAGVLSAASNLVYVYLPELFPTDLRASGVGLAVAASRIGSAAGTFVLPLIVAAYGVRTALGACVGVLALGGAICYRWAPETRGVGLAALDQLARTDVAAVGAHAPQGHELPGEVRP